MAKGFASFLRQKAKAENKPLSSLLRREPLGDGEPTPLGQLIPVYVAVAIHDDIQKGITLDRLTLREYASKAKVARLSYAIGNDEPVEVDIAEPRDVQANLDRIQAAAASNQHVIVAHHAAFVVRMLRYMLGLLFPCHAWCTMEGSMACWPDLEGGFSLANIMRRIWVRQTVDQEARRGSTSEINDIRTLYRRQTTRLPAQEQAIGLLTQAMRGHHLVIDAESHGGLVDAFSQAIGEIHADLIKSVSEMTANKVSASDLVDIFGILDASDGIKSVRSARLRSLLLQKLGFTSETTSLKHMSPADQAKNPEATAVLKETQRINKALGCKRRTKHLARMTEWDIELGYHRAVTGRFSSPSVGKGINLHAIPKHDLAIARPFRSHICFPEGKCAVRGDLANVEYRTAGLLSGCTTIRKMFDRETGGDPLQDPYCSLWKAMTGVQITKKDPVRQIAKKTVLGLNFMMGVRGFAKELLLATADPTTGLTQAVATAALQQMQDIPRQADVQRIIDEIECPPVIAILAQAVYTEFHKRHPELRILADWLVQCTEAVANANGSLLVARSNLAVYQGSQRAPDPALLSLDLDIDLGEPAIRVSCGKWPATLTWRNPAWTIDPRTGRSQVTIAKAVEARKRFSAQLAIENVTQAAARNGLCWGLLKLSEMGYRDVLHVHDEVMLIVPQERNAVLKARHALLSVFGSTECHPLGWAMVMNPNEISVTKSLFEDPDDLKESIIIGPDGEKIGDRWNRIERNEPDCLNGLP